MAWTFGDKPAWVRAAYLKRERLNADWVVLSAERAAVNGPLGSVIGNLRARAFRARSAASRFLVLLFVTAASGLVFYLGLPFWQSFADGRLDTLNATLRTIEVEDATLDGQREELRGEVAETLALTFDSVQTGTDAWLGGHVQRGEALLLYGGGSVLRARPDLSGFDPVPKGTGAPLDGHVQQGDALLLYGGGSVLRARPDLSGFDPIPKGTGLRLYGHVQQGDALLLYGAGGTVLRARPDLSGFDPIPTGTRAALGGSVRQGDALLLYGARGTVLRARPDLSGFDPVPTGTYETLFGHMQQDDALLFYGEGGTVLRARPDLSGFDPVPTGTDVRLTRHVQQGDALLLYGEGGTVLRQPSGRKAEAEAVMLSAGPDGDAALTAFLDGLPPHLRGWSAIQDYDDALTAITNQRRALDILRSRTDAEIEEYKRSPLAYLRNDTAVAFERFLALCRGNSDAPEVTSACLTAWQTEQTGGQTWWRGVLDQVPPGILLLFLLATSAALYRYNLRLAGFHDSRADVLTLLVQTRNPTELGALLAATPADVGNLTALVMAADKVEMGAIKAKLGAAEVEVARLLTSDGKGDG
jgi:hypothetical protein